MLAVLLRAPQPARHRLQTLLRLALLERLPLLGRCAAERLPREPHLDPAACASAENRPSTASITCSATVRPNRASHARGIGPVFSIVPSVRFPGAAGTPSMLRTVQRIQLIPLETATRKGADTLNVRYQNNRITFKITDWTTREAVSKRIGILKRQYTLVEKYRMGWPAWFER